MALRLPVARLLPAAHTCYYLNGEDSDGIFEMAELLLADEADGATLLRVDIGELELIHQHLQPGLFGEARCHAMLRNAGSARPNQIDQLEKLAGQPPPGLRLVICALGMDSKKALHKRISALPDVVACTIGRMDEAEFSRWLARIARDAGLKLSDEALMLMNGHLLGMRMASRQAVERLRLFDSGQGRALDAEVVGDLIGERSPGNLSALCRAVAERSPQAIVLLRRLLREQQVSEVQVLTWISMRLQQLLLFAWYAKSDKRNASRLANLFGEARHLVPQEIRHWQPQELMQAMQRMAQVEMLLKGASTEQKVVALERFVLGLIDGATV